MLNWLVGNFELLDVSVQNWMVLTAAGLALYLVSLAIFRRGRRVL